MQRAIWVLWPAFIVGGITETVFFTLFDPEDMRLFGEAITLSRSAVYTLGFFVFWMLAAIPSVLTCFFQRSAADINRLCPLDPHERPLGCPKREDCDQCHQ